MTVAAARRCCAPGERRRRGDVELSGVPERSGGAASVDEDAGARPAVFERLDGFGRGASPPTRSSAPKARRASTSRHSSASCRHGSTRSSPSRRPPRPAPVPTAAWPAPAPKSSPVRLADLAASGRLEVPIAATLPLADVQRAFELLEQRHHDGKVVLLP
ncbi:zinc-binding dehydrogenase [Streptomyces sp. NPDC052109]|uniref:zinc-binding dehydrogenase n=1 Tax=Streptomyces sp. NPDC052109 TaxID=3155527 RepID=UPI00342E45E7